MPGAGPRSLFAQCFVCRVQFPLGRSPGMNIQEVWMLTELHSGVPSNQAGRVCAHPEPLLSTST